MENLIESIKSALASDASEEARLAGVQACRTILTALETPAGEPMGTATVSSSAAIEPSSPLQAAVAALRGLPPDQLLDLAIARLKAALPAGAEAPQVRRLNVPLVAVGPLHGGRP
jgi:hypothetical protein